jgi:alkylhydroperoxidase family enzyme
LEPPYEPAIQAQFDAIMGEGRAPLVLFRTLARSGRAWRKFRAGSLLDPGPLSLREREILILRTCARAGCEYEWGVHVAVFAKAAGLTGAEVAATALAPPTPGGWSAAELALISAADALHERATLAQGEFDALRAHYSDEQILEVLLLCGFYRTVAYLANGLELPLEPGAPRLPQG